MPDNGFVLAYKPPHGNKRMVPKHYLTNPALGYKAAPTGTVQEPAEPDPQEPATTHITEPGKPGRKPKEVTG